MTAICSKCGTRPRSSNHSWCLPCKNDDRNARRDRNRDYVLNYLLEHPCEICGERDVRTLDFHHKDPAAKSANIAEMILHAKRASLIAEMEKCRVFCKNDHARHTAEQANTYKHRMTSQ